MNPRTKWLLVGCVAVFGLYFADAAYRSWIEQPTQELNARFDALTEELRETKDTQLMAQKLGKRLDDYAARALPYDPQLARSLYQEWLLNVVERHQLAAASVDPGQPVPVEVRSRTKRGKRERLGYRIAYTLRGQATLAKLAGFLDDFRQAGHLHKIRTLSLNPTGKEGVLDANFSIEVLSLEAAPSKDQLSDWRLVSDVPLESEPTRGHDFVHRNLFARGFARALYEVQLKAITFDRNGQPQAWFRTAAGDKTSTLNVGEQVPVALHDIAVVEILPGRVLVNVNQVPYWLELGQTLGDLMVAEDRTHALSID